VEGGAKNLGYHIGNTEIIQCLIGPGALICLDKQKEGRQLLSKEKELKKTTKTAMENKGGRGFTSGSLLDSQNWERR